MKMDRFEDIEPELERRSAELRGEMPAQQQEPSVHLPTLALARLADIDPEPKRFAVGRLAPAGEVTLFTGPGSAGKSLLAQQIATAIAAGSSTLGLEMVNGPAVYVTCEDDERELHWRQAHICKALNVPMASLDGRLLLSSLRGRLDNALEVMKEKGEPEPSPLYKLLSLTIRSRGAQILFLDNLAHLFVGNENDRGEVTRFVNLLNRLAGETGAAIVLLGHPNKSGDDYSGSTAWLNAVRSQFNIEHDLDTDLRTLRVGQANYGRKGEICRFLWIDWAFVLEDDLPPDRAKALRDTAEATADNNIFLTCLREMAKQKRNVSEKPSSTYAPKLFSRMAESKGIGKDRLEKAMDRLFRIEAIERGEMPWDDGHRHAVIGLREAAGDPA